MKTLIGFALGSLLSLGTVTSAFASGANLATPARFTDDGVEVIVVTAKRPAAQPVAADDAGRDARGRATQDAVAEIEVIVVTGKRPTTTTTTAERTPPAMPIVMPKLELAAEPLVIRL